MNAVARILGENDETVPVWPIEVEFTGSFSIDNLSHAWEKYEEALDSHQTRPMAMAIEKALNIKVLGELLDKSDHPEVDTEALALSGDILNDPSEEDWEGDDGLVVRDNRELKAIIKWVDLVKDAEGYVRYTGARNFLATANRHVSKAIGTWLKSIGVPFEYNVNPDA